MARLLGILAGVVLALVLADRVPVRAPASQPGPILSECDGALRHVVVQYVRGATFTLPTYRAFLAGLSADAAVDVLCPEAEDYAEFRSSVGAVSARQRPIFAHHPMTCWSRDRWLCRAASGGCPATLVAPSAEAGAGAWVAREGDSRVAFDLAGALRGECVARRSGLYFDGGDLLADGETVFVTPAVVAANLGRSVRDVPELVGELGRLCGGKRVVLLKQAPPHHAGMFMCAVGDRTVVVGSPALAMAADSSIRASAAEALPGGPDLSPGTQALFDAVAGQIAGEGYRVVRIPCLVAADDPKVYLTYCNGLVERRAGVGRTFYMPSFRGQDRLNAAAAAVFAGLGVEVRPVDVTDVYRYNGTLHCLVNVIGRGGV